MVNAEDNTDYGVKNDAAQDFDDLSGSDMSSDDEGAAGNGGVESDRFGLGVQNDGQQKVEDSVKTVAVTDGRWARALQILKEGQVGFFLLVFSFFFFCSCWVDGLMMASLF